MLGAIACGVLLPLIGLALSLAVRSKIAACGFTLALILTFVAGMATGVISKDSARALRDRLDRTAEPTPPPG